MRSFTAFRMTNGVLLQSHDSNKFNAGKSYLPLFSLGRRLVRAAIFFVAHGNVFGRKTPFPLKSFFAIMRFLLKNSIMATGALGFEPRSFVLETKILPLNYAPIFCKNVSAIVSSHHDKSWLSRNLLQNYLESLFCKRSIIWILAFMRLIIVFAI